VPATYPELLKIRAEEGALESFAVKLRATPNPLIPTYPQHLGR
jgi:hypothetical protein